MPLTKPIIIKPKAKRKKRARRLFLLGLIFLTFITALLYFYLSWRIKKETQEIEELKLKNERLRQEIKELQSSEAKYEELIRRRLGYLRDGERLIIYHEEKPVDRR